MTRNFHKLFKTSKGLVGALLLFPQNGIPAVTAVVAPATRVLGIEGIIKIVVFTAMNAQVIGM